MGDYFNDFLSKLNNSVNEEEEKIPTLASMMNYVHRDGVWTICPIYMTRLLRTIVHSGVYP